MLSRRLRETTPGKYLGSWPEMCSSEPETVNGEAVTGLEKTWDCALTAGLPVSTLADLPIMFGPCTCEAGDGAWLCCLEFAVTVFLEDIARDATLCAAASTAAALSAIDVYLSTLAATGQSQHKL